MIFDQSREPEESEPRKLGAADVRRTSLVRVTRSDAPANEPRSFHAIHEEAQADARDILHGREMGMSEADLIEADRAYALRKAADPFRQRETDRAQEEELRRMPNHGYLHG